MYFAEGSKPELTTDCGHHAIRMVRLVEAGLPQAVRWFIERFAGGGALDLSQVDRLHARGAMRRRILELLVEAAQEHELLLTPPEIVTLGVLPEKLYLPKHPFAGDLAQQLAWVKVLQATKAERLAVLVRNVPPADDLPAWLSLGKMLADLHRELLADALDCNDVLKAGGKVPAFKESDRWKLLADLERRYLALLDSLQVWDIQTARKFAVEHGECRAPGPIVLVGLVDLNRVQRNMLDQVADQVTALVFAPGQISATGRGWEIRARARLFDEHGCLQPDAWRDFSLPLTTDQIEIVDGPGDQANAVIRALGKFAGAHAAEEIVVGVPDKRLVPYLRQRFAESNLAVRYAGGMPMTHAGPCQLLLEAADYLEHRRFSDLAALIRHPAVADWLLASGVKHDWLHVVRPFLFRPFAGRIDRSLAVGRSRG